MDKLLGVRVQYSYKEIYSSQINLIIVHANFKERPFISYINLPWLAFITVPNIVLVKYNSYNYCFLIDWTLEKSERLELVGQFLPSFASVIITVFVSKNDCQSVEL